MLLIIWANSLGSRFTMWSLFSMDSPPFRGAALGTQVDVLERGIGGIAVEQHIDGTLDPEMLGA